MIWDDSAEADPFADLLSAQRQIEASSGYRQNEILMNAEMKERYVRMMVWVEETTKILNATPRCRWIRRRVLERLLYGKRRSKLKRRFDLWRYERKATEW